MKNRIFYIKNSFPIHCTPMKVALEEAQKALALDEVPIGAVVTHEGAIIAAAHNFTRTSFDPTGHAEMRAIRIACKRLCSERLVKCDLYTTLEPCTMCAAAISFSRISRLYYGVGDRKGGAVEHGSCFFNSSNCHHAPEVYPSMAEEECKQLLNFFFEKKRTLNSKREDILTLGLRKIL